jgi:hypothetical protein
LGHSHSGEECKSEFYLERVKFGWYRSKQL